MRRGLVFERVPDDWRAPRSRRSEVVEAVIDGATVFIPGVQPHNIGGRMTTIRRAVPGCVVRTRKVEKDGVPGVVVWLERP